MVRVPNGGKESLEANNPPGRKARQQFQAPGWASRSQHAFLFAGNGDRTSPLHERIVLVGVAQARVVAASLRAEHPKPLVRSMLEV